MANQLHIEQLRAIFDSAFEFMGLLAPDGTLLAANRAALRFARVSRGDVVGKKFWDTPWWHGGDRERLKRSIAEAAAGAFVRYETEHGAPDGRQIALDFSLTPVRDAEGQVICIVPEGRDITERKRAERDLRLSEEKYQGILAISADAVISIDVDQRIILFNHGAEEIFGYRAEEVIGQPLATLLPEPYHTAHRDFVHRFGSGREVARRMGERGEIFGRRKSGDIFPADASISRIDVGGTRIFTAVLRDVSDRKAAEDEQARLYEQAQRATRARDEVLGLVSHDLRNPLSAIAMCLPALRAQSEAVARSALLDTIEGSLDLMNRLIQDLLDVSSIESGRLSIRRSDVTVSGLLRETEAHFAPDAVERGIALRVVLPDRLPTIDADPQRLAQLLHNLVGNALKFTAPGGEVTIEASCQEDDVMLVVTDTGPGIPADQVPRIFDRFWHAPRNARERGTGLGLTIARGIAEAHGGHIGVRSTVGVGSTFTVTLPVQEPNTAAT